MNHLDEAYIAGRYGKSFSYMQSFMYHTTKGNGMHLRRLALLEASLAMAGASLGSVANKVIDKAERPTGGGMDMAPSNGGLKGSTAALEHFSQARREHVHTDSCGHSKPKEPDQAGAARLLAAEEKRERKRLRNLKQVAA